MADFRVDVFKGIRPRISSRLLPQNEAQTAENVRLGSGKLEPWSGIDPTADTIPPGTTSIHLLRNNGSPEWLTSSNDVDYAPGPVPDDALERTYYTGEAEPRMTYIGIAPTDYRYLGIPAPTTAPTVVGEALPPDSITGTMTADSLVTNSLKADFCIEDNLPANVYGWYMGTDAGYDAVGTIRVFDMDFYVGQEIRIASVVDANTVTIEDANGAPYLARTTQQARVSGGITHFRTEDTGTGRDGHFRFYIPNGVRVTLTAHNLEVGDIIRITSVPSTIAVRMTQEATGVGNELFMGWESDNGSGSAATNTWPAAPISVSGDDFWIAGVRGYPFVDVWRGVLGPADAENFTVTGNFAWELAERDGVPYSTIAANIESRAYVYTFVSELGEEGPPSPASDVVTIPSGGDVTVGTFETPPSTKRNITNMRIYRANTGSDQTVYQFVAEIASPFADYLDQVADLDLGEVLQTESWDPPPSNLRGITALPNGGMAGFYGKTVCFAEPYYPHAWPPEYQIAVDHDVVGLGVVPNGVAILTKGPVYIASGDHPRAMSVRHFNDSQACSSKRSIASTIGGVLYSSPDGLAFVGSSGFRLVTEAYATKREWQASFEPTAIKGFWHDGKYIGFHTTGGFVFDPDDETIGLSTHDQVIDAGYLDTENDILYVIGPNIIGGAASSALFVVSSGQTGTGDVVKMSDAQVFTACGPSGTGAWQDVAYDSGAGRWIICASAGTPRLAYTANEGTSWTNSTVNGGSSQAWQSIAYSPSVNRSVVVASAGTGRIAYSNDGGATYTAITTHDTHSFLGVEWDPYRSLFIAVNGTAGSQVLTSPDGITWTVRTTPLSSGAIGTGIGITQEWIVLAVINSNPQPRSADGITWEAAPFHSGDKLRTDGNEDTIVAAGSTGKARTSDGGSTAWQSVSGIDFSYGAVGYSDRLSKWFMFPASDGSARYAESSDPAAATWMTISEALFGSKNWNRIGFGDGSPVVGIWDEDAAAPLTMTWKSGRVRCQYPLNLGAARVHSDAYPVTFRLYNDQGDLVTTRTVTSDEVFRLPTGYLTTWFEVEIEGTKAVNTVHVAETVAELLQG